MGGVSVKMIFDLRLFKGSSTTVNNTSTYTPSEYELQLQKIQADYADKVAPNSYWLNETARKVLQDSLGTVQVDFNQLNNQAQNQISQAQSGINSLTGNLQNQLSGIQGNVSNLASGQLPQAYLDNMQKSIQSGVENSVGQVVNNLGQRGVLNSSVTTKAVDDISKNVANTMAQQYQNNIGLLSGLYGQQAGNTLNGASALSGLYGQQIDSANAGTTAAGIAQEGAQAPAMNLWNASLGLNGSTNSALSAAAGKGTTNSSQTTKTSGGGGGLLGGFLGGLL